MVALIAGVPGGFELVVLLVVALLIFGGTRLANLGKGAGRAVREFREETADLRKKDEPAEIKPAEAPVTRVETAAPVETPVVETREVTEVVPPVDPRA